MNPPAAAGFFVRHTSLIMLRVLLSSAAPIRLPTNCVLVITAAVIDHI
jgi:hypothetical protein